MDDRLHPVVLPEVERLDSIAQSRLREAQARLEALAQRQDASPGVLGRTYGATGMLYHAHRFLDAAEACYRNARTLEPDSFRWPYILGHLYAEKDAGDLAIRSFRQALEIDPDHVGALVELGRWQLAINRLAEAQETLERALTRDEYCAPAMIGLGRIATASGRHAEAVDLFEEALRIAPEASSIHYHLGMAYRELGLLGQAEEHLRKRGVVKAVLPDPLLDELKSLVAGAIHHTERGVAAATVGRYEEAAGEFRKALAAEPDNPTHHMHLALALDKLDDREAAERSLEQALRLSPDHERAHLHLAELLAEGGEERRAVKHFRQALDSNPNSTAAALGLAKALQRLGDHEEALAPYATALRMDPASAEARLGRAFALIRLGRWAEAKAKLMEDVEVLPEQPAFRHALARLLGASPDDRVRDGGRALELARELMEELQTADLAETLAMALAEQGWFREAAEIQEQAIAVAEEAGRPEIVRRMKRNLALYEEGKPCRQPWEENDPVFQPAQNPYGGDDADGTAAP